ncbi:MAG: hypothetical protein AB8G22_21140, partial [Saprospiraceae bacterium]
GTITVTGSESGVNYQLRLNSDDSNVGAAVAGTGSDITFTVSGITTSTDYNVLATNGTSSCAVEMTDLASVTVNPIPTITLGTSPSVCAGATSADLAYTATTNSPDEYMIDFDAAAEAAGFVDVTFTTLPSSPISIVVPGAAAADTYNATLKVRDGTTTCESTATAFTVTVTEIVVSNATTTCDDAGTGGTDADDFFTIDLTATNANPGASGKYEVVYNDGSGDVVMNPGGTDYGSPVSFNNSQGFAADGITTYTLTIRDLDDGFCTMTYTVGPVSPCSTCPDTICLPITFKRKSNP